MVLRGSFAGLGPLRLSAFARDSRKEALRDRGVLPQQLLGRRGRGQGAQAQSQEASPAEGTGGRDGSAQSKGTR